MEYFSHVVFIRQSDISLRDSSVHFFAMTFFKNGQFENLRNLHFVKKEASSFIFFVSWHTLVADDT